MSQAQKNVVTWFSLRPTRLEQQHFESLWHLLTRSGYRVNWLEVPNGADTATIQAWIAKTLPIDTGTLFFGGRELERFRQLISGVRALTGNPVSLLPLFWVCEELDTHHLELMAEEGVNDFIPVSITAHELKTRLSIRFREFQSRYQLDEQRKDERANNARNETILKQREEFLGVCAHDLRSPLGLIQSSSQLVLKNHSGKGSLSPTEHELISRIKRQATHALNLVTDLLDVMSFEQGFQPDYALLNLHEHLTDFYSDYRMQAENKGISFHYDNAVPDWRVFADADRMRQMLQNLFANAIKFTEPGKNIYLSVSPFNGRRKNDPTYPMIIISLKDEGKGMGQREMQKIFDRFSAIKDHSNPEGRGLGLTVARQISTLHEGNIWAESAEGQGSTFFALFPHVVSRLTSLSEKEKATFAGKTRIVVAEPSKERREKYYDKLQNEAVEIIYAKDGVEALALTFHHVPDLLILPVTLPKIDTINVIDLLRQEILISNTPLFLAAEEEEKAENRIDTHKFDRVLKLPVTQETFVTTLQSVGKLLPLKKAA